MDIALDIQGNIYVTGSSDSTFTGQDFLTIKYDPSGILLWSARYNGPGNFDDFAVALAIDSGGNVYVTGYSYGNNGEDYATVKYNSSGVQQWAVRYNGPDNFWDFPSSIAVDDSGNVLITGTSATGTNYYSEYATIKYNSAGNEQWVKKTNFGGVDNYAAAITCDGFGNTYVTGTSNQDYATVKYDPSGVELWTKTYNGPANSIDGAIAIAYDENGFVVVTGYSYSTTSGDYATLKYDPEGQQLWAVRYNGAGNSDDEPTSLALDQYGNVFVTGSSCNIFPNFDFATVKYNSSGVQQWITRRSYLTGSVDEANAITVDKNGSVYVTGSTSPTMSTNTYDYLTIKYNSSGIEQWIRRYDGISGINDMANAIAVDTNGNVYITGATGGGGYGPTDYNTLKYNSAGTMQWSAIYDGPGNSFDQIIDLTTDANGNIYVTGIGRSSNSQYYLTMKYNSSGTQQWVAKYDPPTGYSAEASAIAIDAAGNVYVTGATQNDDSYADYTTIKYNSYGIQQWAVQYSSSNSQSDFAYDIAVDLNGNVYVTGSSPNEFLYNTFTTVKYNSSGIQQWVARHSEQNGQYGIARKISVDNLGNIYVTGYEATVFGPEDIVTIKYNTFGNQQWVATYDGIAGLGDMPSDMTIDTYGNVYVVGTSFNTITKQDYVTIKYNSDGTEQWSVLYNGPQDSLDYGRAIKVDNDGNVYITGESYISLYYSEIATIKYDSAGIMQWTDRYSRTPNSRFIASSIDLDAIGNIYVTGSSYDPSSHYDFTTLKYDPNGKRNWLAFYNGVSNYDDFAAKNMVDANGNIIVAGVFQYGGGQYVWDGGGTVCGIVKYSSFTYTKPQLLSIEGSSFSPTMKWKHLPAASSYTLQISHDASFTALEFSDSTITDTIYTIASPLDTGNHFARVLGKTSGYASDWSNILGFTVVSGETLFTYQFSKRWNLVSIPLTVQEKRKNQLFATSVSSAFAYEGAYIAKDTLTPGKGYWLKFNDDASVPMVGLSLSEDSIPVQAGWNLIGSIAKPVPVSSIMSNPPGLTSSQFFGYQGTYSANDAILPGKGYWVKVNQSGTLILSSTSVILPANRIRIVATSEKPPSSPDELSMQKQPASYALEQNFPNPFNPSTTLQYALPEQSHVVVKIYNVLGQEVVTLVNSIQEAGFKSVEFDASNLPSGIYFYRMQAGNYSDIKKMLLLK